jgi:hypothetical protein
VENRRVTPNFRFDGARGVRIARALAKRLV